MATHSSVLAWRIPGTGHPGGLPSMGSHRVRHDWSDLAAAAAAVQGSVLPSTGLQAPAGSQPLLSRVAGIGLQTWDQSHCPELTDHGLVPLRCGSAREPKRPGEARTAHPPASRREDSSREGPVWQALSGHKRSNTLAVELPRQARGTGTLIPSVWRLVWAGINKYIFKKKKQNYTMGYNATLFKKRNRSTRKNSAEMLS